MALRRALILALAIALVPWVAAADPSSAPQQRIKAAFLSKFGGYVEWPSGSFAGPGSPLVIGVADADAIADELEEATADASLGERAIRVRRLRPGEAAGDCCQIVFVGAGATPERAQQVLASVEGRAVLTVTDAPVAPAGSAINFVPVNDHIRFDISREAVESHRLKLRSQLLRVARQVSSP